MSNLEDLKNNIYQQYMKKALEYAQCAYELNEVPIGALVVLDTTDNFSNNNNYQDKYIIGAGYNQVEKLYTQSAHAEVIALAQAGQQLKNWRLSDCWLYVTLEPCAMCMNLIVLSRIKGVIYGAQSPLFGYHLDNGLQTQLYKKDAPRIISGICAQESADILKKFFDKKRN